METRIHFKSLWSSRKNIGRLWSTTVMKKWGTSIKTTKALYKLGKINYESLSNSDQRHKNSSRYKWKCSIRQSGYSWWCRHLIFTLHFKWWSKSALINMNEKWALVSSYFLVIHSFHFHCFPVMTKSTLRIGLIL